MTIRLGPPAAGSSEGSKQPERPGTVNVGPVTPVTTNERGWEAWAEMIQDKLETIMSALFEEAEQIEQHGEQ